MRIYLECETQCKHHFPSCKVNEVRNILLCDVISSCLLQYMLWNILDTVLQGILWYSIFTFILDVSTSKSMCLTKAHRVYNNTCMLDHGIRRRWMIDFTLLLLYTGRKIPITHWAIQWVEPRSIMNVLTKRKSVCQHWDCTLDSCCQSLYQMSYHSWQKKKEKKIYWRQIKMSHTDQTPQQFCCAE